MTYTTYRRAQRAVSLATRRAAIIGAHPVTPRMLDLAARVILAGMVC
jgi:hypothetical protein